LVPLLAGWIPFAPLDSEYVPDRKYTKSPATALVFATESEQALVPESGVAPMQLE
jgi:hypothetical protein